MPISEKTPRRAVIGLLVALAACFTASALGGLFTASSVDSWYTTLQRPSWTPPGWLFGPVWALLYTMMAVAAWDVWRSGDNVRRPLALFAVQLGLNVAWSALFFGLRSPGLAFVGILTLLAAIIVTAIAFTRRRRRAGLLLLPYAMWTSFAATLNGSIWWLNSA